MIRSITVDHEEGSHCEDEFVCDVNSELKKAYQSTHLSFPKSYENVISHW